jgi:hypothetical protein
MNSYFADLLSEKILKSEDMSQRRIFILNSVWSREYNRGPAFSLSGRFPKELLGTMPQKIFSLVLLKREKD